MKYNTGLFIIGAFIFLNCKAMAPEKVIVITFSGEKQRSTITVHKGDTVLVKLPISSGTGYVWEVGGNQKICKQGITKYENIKSRMPGASLMEVINFDITATGIADITFIYHRPFEKNQPVAKIKRLHLIAK